MPAAGPDDVAAPPAVQAACVILAFEALALAGLGVFELYGTVFGHAGDVVRALLGALLPLGGAVALGTGARGLLNLSAAARTPMVVIQLLAIPVGYSLAFQAGRVVYGGPILIAAVAVIYLLFTPPAREALDRDPPR